MHVLPKLSGGKASGSKYSCFPTLHLFPQGNLQYPKLFTKREQIQVMKITDPSIEYAVGIIILILY